VNIAVGNLQPHAPIVLAHERPIRLGAVDVRPGVREVSGPRGREVLEPRVMQVLVALARARGETVTRDDLIAACWGGRAVGEDAISRVISRLRRTTDGIGRDGWTLETITKVGYRLTPLAGAVAAGGPAGARPRISRRLMIGGAATALGAAGAGAAAWWTVRRPGGSQRARLLVAKAREAQAQGTVESTVQAIAYLREAVSDSPDYAAAWGALAIAYNTSLGHTDPTRQEGVKRLARAAAARALDLDPNDPDGNAALTTTIWIYGNWAEVEPFYEAARRRNPRDSRFHAGYSRLLMSVGRMREAVPPAEAAVKADSFAPWLHYGHGMALWGAGRAEEAERVAREALDLWPRQHALWFLLFNLLTHTGRPDQALAFAANPAYRPGAVPAPDLELSLIAARAVASRSASEIEAVVATHLAAARRGVGYAENAVSWAAALGRPDAAFAAARAMYFNEGFKVPDQRFSPVQGKFNVSGARDTFLLFMPATEPLRADPRFADLVRDIGLVRYWKTAGSRPDDPAVAKVVRA
jgi:tetratricopeptide (TPR) repeat protein